MLIIFNFFRNDRYSNAYGDYNGGYGPSGALGPHGGFGPNSGPFRPPGPPPPLFPPCPPDLMEQGYMWGKGFGPTGPPFRKPSVEDKTLKYLRRKFSTLSLLYCNYVNKLLLSFKDYFDVIN